MARNKLENLDQVLKLPPGLEKPTSLSSFVSSAATPTGKAEFISRVLNSVSPFIWKSISENMSYISPPSSQPLPSSSSSYSIKKECEVKWCTCDLVQVTSIGFDGQSHMKQYTLHRDVSVEPAQQFWVLPK